MTTTTEQAVELEQVKRLLDTAIPIIRPPLLRSADEWADEHRVLPMGSPEPGPWRTDRVPYTRPIYRAFTDPAYSEIVAAMGAQMSKTELVMNVIGHRFCEGPYVPTLYIGPTEKQVRSMSTDRFMKMIRSTPVLWNRMHKGQADKVAEKWIGGIRLGFGWAGSATELASHPAGLVMVDERDRMIGDVSGEGDPVEMVKARGSNYYGFTLGVFSTPTIAGASAIWTMFEEGTMEKWAWCCWKCNAYFVPYAALLVYESAETDDAALRESARVTCPHCGYAHESKLKEQLNAAGKYLPHMLNERTGEHVLAEEKRRSTTASFWVSGLASPWQTFGQRALRLARAYRSREPERIQGVINTAFGEPFKMVGDAPEWTAVYEARNEYEQHVVPPWVQLVTMGVDVQKRGLFYVVRGWGFGGRSHLIDHDYLAGESEYDDVWLRWQSVLNQTVEERYWIHVAFVDSGYKPGSDSYRRPQHKVYEVCRRLRGRAFPTKGQDEMDRPLRSSLIDVTVGGRVIKGGLTLWHVNTDHIKTWLHAQLDPIDETAQQVERLWTVHANVDEDYCRQVVAEELVVKPSGRRVWVRAKRANHYLDCEVLARAAAISRQVHALPDLSHAQSTPADQPAAPPPPSSPSFVHPGEQSFFAKYRR